MGNWFGSLESMVINKEFWDGKRVLITGHTGFKGGWLSLWLQSLGARVVGYALAPPTHPNLFEVARVGAGMTGIIGDVRDLAHLHSVFERHQPEIVFHMAAQPLVRYSYSNPVETYATNVMGTVNLLEAVRQTASVKAVINVTSDKCYENREWVWGYRENEPMGGFDPYSSSKGCAELVTSAFRNSFFNAADSQRHGVALASARAGNVIGGGDWAEDRLVPDVMRALPAGKAIVIRNPHAVRPWQHVLEPLSGYLLLAQKLWESGQEFADAWNFGPTDRDAQPVSRLVEQITALWGGDARWVLDNGEHPHEAHYLKLDCSKAREQLLWEPRWDLEHTLMAVVAWYQAHHSGSDMQTFTLGQIEDYLSESHTVKVEL